MFDVGIDVIISREALAKRIRLGALLVCATASQGGPDDAVVSLGAHVFKSFRNGYAQSIDTWCELRADLQDRHGFKLCVQTGLAIAVDLVKMWLCLAAPNRFVQ